MAGCLFCGIVKKEIPSELVHEDAQVVAFADIRPQAPHHLLVVPKKHVATVNDLEAGDEALFGHLALVARALMAARGQTDYRLVMNCGALSGQSVFHIHLHVIAGRAFSWPPG